ncbi:hypothetical protein [Actinomadura coerulea]|uniref:hypothetical protein n=1 Tax=Actinomadura coerulea TaxID=46159 RepID=UPI0034164FBB
MLGASADLTGTAAPLEDVWGRDAGRFEDELRAAGSWDERFVIAADVLGRRLGARTPVDPEVARTWRLTLAGRGRVRVVRLRRPAPPPREARTFAGLTPAGVAAAPWLAVDDVAWPASWPTRIPARHGGRVLPGTCPR